MDGDAVWAAAGPNALKYIRGKEVPFVRVLMYFWDLMKPGPPSGESSGNCSVIHYDFWITTPRFDGRWKSHAAMGYKGRR